MICVPDSGMYKYLQQRDLGELYCPKLPVASALSD